MKNIIFAMLFLLIATTVNAGWKAAVQQNVQESNATYETILSNMEGEKRIIRIWIHVRAESQQELAKRIFKKLENSSLLADASIEEKPIRVVEVGPSESQIRYFKAQDKKNAIQLRGAMEDLVPNLTLIDFSKEYSSISWLKPGHIEIWLSPEIGNITPTPNEDALPAK